jgi:hypothetical protein
MIFAVLATGQSLTQEVVDSLRDRVKVVAVSNAYRLAPWADAMVSCDASWWKNNREALDFEGRKFTIAPDWQGFPDLERFPGITSGTNSGLLGLMVAVKLGATRILMLGFDMHGTHFFGAHPLPLRNPSRDRFEVFKRQFGKYQPRGVEILNCTPDSHLMAYPKMDLAAALEGPSHAEDHQMHRGSVDQGGRLRA